MLMLLYGVEWTLSEVRLCLKLTRNGGDWTWVRALAPSRNARRPVEPFEHPVRFRHKGEWRVLVYSVLFGR